MLERLCGQTKVTPVTCAVCRKFALEDLPCEVNTPHDSRALVEVSHGTCAGAARIAAGAAPASRSRCAAAARALGGYCENAQLRAKFLAFALWTLRLVAAKNQGFKFVLTFLTDIFKNRHDVHSLAAVCSY